MQSANRNATFFFSLHKVVQLPIEIEEIYTESGTDRETDKYR